jgi:hypothetical protein
MKTSNEREMRINVPSAPASEISADRVMTQEANGSQEELATAQHPVRLKFDLQLHSIKEFASIMQMVIDKISHLRMDKSLESCNLNLCEMPPGGAKKMANLHICIDGNQFVTESKSSRWDNAFLNAFDHFCTKMKS